ncbi:bifunctional glucosamine-1-phosphate N-acetyltransferase/UDP-N-acetylglucosamine pyrophosphorylase [Microbacterium sp. 8M]|uniref:bifunctional UDP-N-acetylglucosamine diphosphorylase/glucosamine-1-phosphate N-acetyltransferase GlmU n=1 Tax=Microbacterium sp. 8M TaxID=2653153 RepID=UPI0012F073B4|nr:bifunctional UDP-N-acetylglucosamine diphosphorylase/glucosamine-1-phosphate N-acetyltransferase GlmU [Microbacterium sp. 8M]VXB16026.1 bifunctional glucosamine-1-phosphate N-acetyltransferase/UDP-N-acetylglucosamine pyrophosphorylase [Microbacterium sp. 8M]
MTQNALAIIVLAAGQGTRMKSRLPKVLHPIAGRTLVGHVLATASRLGADTIEVVVRHERDQVVAALEAEHPDVVIVDQDEIPGTGRAVQVALDALPSGFDGDVLVLSGDVPLLEAETLQALVDGHRAAAAAATVLSAIVDDPTGYGRIIRDADGDVARIVEQKDADEAEQATREINAGVYVFRAGLLRTQLAQVTTDNAQGEMYLTTVIGLLRENDEKVAVEIAADTAATFGINDRIQLAEAARTLNDRIVRRWQREGVTIQDPATTWIDDDVTLAPDVTILPNTHILRASTVATGAVVGPDTTLVSTEVGEDAEVRRSEATLAVIGARATVGPFSYLRAGTTLGEGGKIGAYVETKNAQIGDGSKVPHLSYVGDATVGRGVNLGASTITANYDDVNKHRTEIGDEVHTGSHTVLVAPVRLGAGAKTGAGAVVRKDVPAGALAMTVAPQRNIEGWVEKNRAGTAAAEAARADSAE